MKKAKLIDLINLVLKPEKTPGMLFISLKNRQRAGRPEPVLLYRTSLGIVAGQRTKLMLIQR
jgi:hypothetical protein